MKLFKFSLLFVVVATLMSCNNQQSLQEYYIDSKENEDFIMVDLPTSLISPKSETLSPEQKKGDSICKEN